MRIWIDTVIMRIWIYAETLPEVEMQEPRRLEVSTVHQKVNGGLAMERGWESLIPMNTQDS